jgi:hypothetical protein
MDETLGRVLALARLHSVAAYDGAYFRLKELQDLPPSTRAACHASINVRFSWLGQVISRPKKFFRTVPRGSDLPPDSSHSNFVQPPQQHTHILKQPPANPEAR